MPSAAEDEVVKVLKEWGITPETEIKVKIQGKNLRFDVKFSYKSHTYFVEPDGIQHFEFTEHFHDEEDEDFEEGQEHDILKTLYCLQNNYRLIRIDYTQFKAIRTHLTQALLHPRPLYLSTPEKYDYIIATLHEDEDKDERLALTLSSLTCSCKECAQNLTKTSALISKTFARVVTDAEDEEDDSFIEDDLGLDSLSLGSSHSLSPSVLGKAFRLSAV